MKKFDFSLEHVLDYKKQLLDAKKAEHGLILAKVRQQESVLSEAKMRYTVTNEDFREKKQNGLTIAGLRSYEMGLHVLAQKILQEEKTLSALREQEASIRAELVNSKIEKASLELLRKKKLAAYHHDLQKKSEQWIDELISSSRFLSSHSIL